MCSEGNVICTGYYSKNEIEKRYYDGRYKYGNRFNRGDVI